jgi:citrate lyase beta subunit
VGKTAIHPSQVALIEQHYRVHHSDVEAALRIMNPESPAVFKMHDSMCEVATHRAWAHGVVEQARIFGIHQADGGPTHGAVASSNQQQDNALKA